MIKLVPDNFTCPDEVRKKFETVLNGVAPLIHKKAIQLSFKIGEDVADIEQMFRMTLMAAMVKFDPNKGVKFSTYFYQSLNNVAPMIISYHFAQKRNPHYIDSETNKVQLSPHSVYPSPEQWLAEEPLALGHHAHKREDCWLVHRNTPETILMDLEHNRVSKMNRQRLFESLDKPIDRKVLQMVLNPPQDLRDLAEVLTRSFQVISYLSQKIGATTGQIKSSLKRIKAKMILLATTSNNKDTGEKSCVLTSQSLVGQILTGGDDMSDEQKDEQGSGGCVGFYEVGLAECDGNPSAKQEKEKEPCAKRDECKPIADAARAVAEAEGGEWTNIVKTAATAGEDGIIALLQKGTELMKKGGKSKGKKAKQEAPKADTPTPAPAEAPKADTSTETPAETADAKAKPDKSKPKAAKEKPKAAKATAKPQSDTKAKEKPAPADASEPATEPAGEETKKAAPKAKAEPKPKVISGMLDPNNPSRLLAMTLAHKIAAAFSKTLMDKAAAQNDGDFYIIDKTPLGGGGSGYLTMYCHKTTGREQGLAILYIKPRTGNIDVGLPCPDTNIAQKAVPFKTDIKDTAFDGAFKARLMGVVEANTDGVVKAIQKLNTDGVIHV